MLLRFHDAAVYDVLYTYPDLQAYRKGLFTGWIRQPAKTGPVLFTNSSPTYARLAPVAAGTGGAADDGGGGAGTIVAIVVAVVVVAGGAFLVLRRRRSAYERE
jgi:peptide/nickel transport system substrate-binding protein